MLNRHWSSDAKCDFQHSGVTGPRLAVPMSVIAESGKYVTLRGGSCCGAVSLVKSRTHPETATINRIDHHILVPSSFADEFREHLQRKPLHGDPLRFNWCLVDCFVAGQRYFLLIQRDWGYLVLLDGIAEDSIVHLPSKLLAAFEQVFLDDDNAELPDYALASLELDPDAVTWSVVDDISHNLLERLKTAVEQIESCADVQTASYAVESLNQTPITLNGQEYSPEDAFAKLLGDLEDQFEDYRSSNGVLRRLWHVLTGKRPWMAARLER